jgi:hypothetical protein
MPDLGLTEQIVIKDLSTDALDMKPEDYDWSEGYPEEWDYMEAPSCPECDSYCRWHQHEWQCRNRECDNFGNEVDPHENYCEGPMMNYHYPLPETHMGGFEMADAIRDLPLCVVNWMNEDGYSLALTGGGMDLSWQICEAFMRLGFLPPVHFADLPGMAGTGDRPDERKVVKACVRSLEEWAVISNRRADNYHEDAQRLRKKYLT